MINYSNVKRSVNANLLEINQAKARIKEAKAKGETPKQADVELVNTEVQKTFCRGTVFRGDDHREICQAYLEPWLRV